MIEVLVSILGWDINNPDGVLLEFSPVPLGKCPDDALN
jgi:predicted type IV restriction endonuclease